MSLFTIGLIGWVYLLAEFVLLIAVVFLVVVFDCWFILRVSVPGAACVCIGCYGVCRCLLSLWLHAVWILVFWFML